MYQYDIEIINKKDGIMENTYKPEGINRNLSNEEYKRKLKSQNIIYDNYIFEAPVTKCDSELNLWVELGIGVDCMIPKSEATYLFPGESLKDVAIISRVGKQVSFKITGIKKNEFGKDVFIASRRLAQLECIKNYVSKLIPGDIIDARVTHMEQFGAFCDIGCGITALLSVDCISVSRISHPRDRFSTGDKIRAIVKSVSEQGRIYLTHKELLGSWEENVSFFSAGQTVAGIVRSIENYGIFVELTPNLAGLAEMKDNVYPSQRAAVYIKAIIPERMKIKLVLIDWTDRTEETNTIKYIGDIYKKDHIDRWVYSPECSNKITETVF